jgi:hypothetical protein
MTERELIPLIIELCHQQDPGTAASTSTSWRWPKSSGTRTGSAKATCSS